MPPESLERLIRDRLSFGTLKLGLPHGRRSRTREEAKATIFEHIEIFHNRKRRHSSLGMHSPIEFEKTLTYPSEVA